MKFQLSIFSHPWDPELAIPENQFKTSSEALAKLYLNRANYLKIGTKPVIAIGDAKGIGDGTPAAVGRFVQALRRAAFNFNSRQELIVLIGLGALIGWHLVPDVEGTQTHVPNHGNMPPGIAYASWIDGVVPFFKMVTQAMPLPLAPSFASNFDERPRQDVMIPDPGAIRYFSNVTLAEIERGLTEVVQYAKAQPSPIAKLISIYAWNEWHEGGVIEPDVKNGDAYLKSIAKVLRANR